MRFTIRFALLKTHRTVFAFSLRPNRTNSKSALPNGFLLVA